jgi:hypothetical protein
MDKTVPYDSFAHFFHPQAPQKIALYFTHTTQTTIFLIKIAVLTHFCLKIILLGGI